MKKSGNPPSVSLVVPAYNNAATLTPQLTHCHAILTSLSPAFEILVCNDGSTDGTAKILKDLQKRFPEIRILTHPVNLGIAPTIRELYRSARNRYVALFSADGDWNPKDVGRLIATAQKTQAAIVIGKRKNKHYTLYRALVSVFYNILPVLLFGIATHDAGSIKVIRRDIIGTIPLRSKSVFFEAELIIRATARGFPVIAVPVSYKKIRKASGLGGKLPWVLASLRDMVQLRLSTLFSPL